MKQNIITLLLISVLSLSACGQNPEDARKELGQMNIPYSEDAFRRNVSMTLRHQVGLFSV
jgi:hypothetical protein